MSPPTPVIIDIDSLWQKGKRMLREAAIPNYAQDASVLLASCLQVTREYLWAHKDQTVQGQMAEEYLRRIKDRCLGVPLQYLCGAQEFWGRDFKVNPAVLIPRPETELLVEKALEYAAGWHSREEESTLLVADAGTGTGCIAITLALEISKCRICATDISCQAIRVAEMNAQRHQVDSSVLQFLQGDLLLPVRELCGVHSLSMVVSNPPYVALEDPDLEKQVKDHEPGVALFGGKDGLAVIRRLVDQAEEMLRPGGILLMEIGHKQEEKVLRLFSEDRWRRIDVWPDGNGIPRCVEARRN